MTSLYSNVKDKPHTAKKTAKEFLIETLRKKNAEEDLIKLAIEKRNKEYERECIQKMTEANILSDKLKQGKSYSVFISEEQEGLLKCRVYDKISHETNDVDLKSFMFLYKKLKKQMQVS